MTAAFVRGVPNYAGDPPAAPYHSDVALYHAQPYGLHDGLRQFVQPTHVVDIGSVMGPKRIMLAMHASQKDWLDASQGICAYVQEMDTNPETGKIGQSFQSFITILEKNQVEYDLGSESIIKAIGSSSNGKLRIGNAAYSTVVIPPNTENLNSETFILLKKFAAGGGRLILFSSPSMLNGSPDEKLKEYFEKGSPNLLKQED